MYRQRLLIACVGLLAVVATGVALRPRRAATDPARPAKGETSAMLTAIGQRPASRSGGMLRIAGGTFLMGSPLADALDARPQHRVTLRTFWLDATLVTNAQFSDFVAATQYETTAERRGHSLVFDAASHGWRTIEGANWRQPNGPNSSIAAREDWPAVQVSWNDALAYARWANKRLPTEAEYEYAARGGLAECDYPWGRELLDGGQYQANAWQGRFPDFDLARDGYAGLAPAAALPPNRYGLRDMLGNAYCWCADWYDPAYYEHCPARDPGGPVSGQEKAQRGGSWLSAPNHEPLALWRRRAAEPNVSTNHVGFRCASDEPHRRASLPGP
jgi:formylglycine-generating enzyme required for sulfatase activity